ncbi:MAG: hypothetical protein LBM97_01210 [Candidatus Nomurabacteria bacterium]|jgi:hypothetical protein|nr:hypothetical protein [Candidatus Nomurabacteria bacterium]
MKKFFVLFTAFTLMTTALLSLGTVPSVAADEISEPTISLSVKPAQQRLELSPNQSKSAEITVVNSGTVGYEIKVSSTPYTVANDYSVNVFDRGNDYTQISRWISFDGETEFYLEPSQSKIINFTINVPASVPAGGQYASIMAETVPPADASGVVAIRRIASLVYANINGNTIDKGEITKRIWQNIITNDEGVEQTATSVTVKNDGNTDFAAQSRLQIIGLFGNSVDEVIDTPKTIFPDTERTVDLVWNKSPVGIYRLILETSYLGETHTATKIVVLIPIWLWFIILIAAIAIIFVIVKIRGHRHARR